MHTLTWILRPIMFALIYILCSCFSPCALKLLKLLIIYYSTSLFWHLPRYLTAACSCSRLGILFTSWVIYLLEVLLLHYYVTDLQPLSSTLSSSSAHDLFASGYESCCKCGTWNPVLGCLTEARELSMSSAVLQFAIPATRTFRLLRTDGFNCCVYRLSCLSVCLSHTSHTSCVSVWVTSIRWSGPIHYTCFDYRTTCLWNYMLFVFFISSRFSSHL
jgi:hypothetical protein